jgi:NAD(P)-dependent dehydrogenase (short-subunit alcohol dehydrogenase family)
MRMGIQVNIRNLLSIVSAVICIVNIADIRAEEIAGAASPTVLITGSNRGIGLEFVRQYAGLGWRVIATCRNPDGADELAEIASSHPNVTIERLDLTDHPEIDGLAALYADTAIDVLVNNAALLGPRGDQAFGRLDYELFQEILAVNTIGTIKVTEAFANHVARSSQKKIVTLGSAAGSIGMVTAPADFYAYRASKAGLHLLMRNTALDLGRQGILVALVNPGLVDTRGFADIGPNDPVPADFKQVVKLIRSGDLELASPEEAVADMIELIAGLTPEQTGVFLNRDGQVLPW